MRAVDWIAVLGVVTALALGLSGVLGIMFVSAGHTRNERLHLLRAERREAYLALLAAKARLDQLIPECSAARTAEAEGRTLTELEQQARRDLVPTYRRFGECVQVAGAFADAETAKTLTPLHRAVTRWITASQQDVPDADRAEAWAVYLRTTTFVRAVRRDLDFADLEGADDYADAGDQTGAGLRPQPAAVTAPPSRQREPEATADRVRTS